MSTFDPFTILDCQRRFDLDPAHVERRYLAAAAATHPDRFSEADAKQQAEEQSAKLNRARTMLLDDEARAESLLTLLGGPARGDDKTLPDGFLIDILETRQEIEQVVKTGDPDHRTRIEQWAQDQRRQYQQHVARLFKEYEQNPDGEALRHIRIQLNAWRYIERLIEQLEQSL